MHGLAGGVSDSRVSRRGHSRMVVVGEGSWRLPVM